MLYKLIGIYFFLKTALCGCGQEVKQRGFTRGKRQYEVIRLGKLDRVVNESSGLTRAGHSTFWTHNDSGSPAVLYEITYTGKVVDSLPLPSLTNRDWESITRDETGSLYIGDVGNNANQRKDLTIYKLRSREDSSAGRITFRYADQQAFPPDKKARNFDSEAMVWRRDSLYVFSKNRGNKLVKQYPLPEQPGDYVTQPAATIFLNSQVTDAAINPDQTTLALLGYGKIFLFDLTDSANLFAKPTQCIKVARNQTEGIVFVNNTDMLITNEQRKVYLVKLRE